jgi:glutamine synthetase
MSNHILAEYIWIDGTQPTRKLRSKTRVLENKAGQITLPRWSFDGSSTGQATGDKSDCILVPVHAFPDPIRGEPHVLVMCEVLLADGETPHPTNSRAPLRKFLEKKDVESLDSWYGLEQEYTLFKGSRPLGFPDDRRFPPAQGPYYCGVGADEAYGRPLVEAHLKACLLAGLKISGINAEVMPGQWEFQVGPLSPLEAGDHLWVARWLLYRLGEDHGITATLDAKPVPGDFNGAGMHCNFSTRFMRSSDEDSDHLTGMKAIEKWCERAAHRVKEHLEACGEGYELRLTGRHETASYAQFKWGVSDRTASIRVPLQAQVEGCGYLEDRRFNANADPYKVAFVMLETAYLADTQLPPPPDCIEMT